MPFVREGLQRGERCLYVADDNSVAIVLKSLREAGISVEEEQSRGALRIATKHETFVREGVFQPQQMIDDLKAEVTGSLEQGYAGFRGAGEMTWALTSTGACGLLADYEAALDDQFPRQFAGLCQYNENAFHPEMISRIIRAHPIIIARGQVIRNVFYKPEAEFSKPNLPQVNVNQVLLRANGLV